MSRAAAHRSDGLWDGHLAVAPAGTFTVLRRRARAVRRRSRSPHRAAPAAGAARPRARAAHCRGRDAARTPASSPSSAARLRYRYTVYVARYGPINRFTLRRTGHIDPESGEERLARIIPRAVQLLRCDPFAPLVRALEVFDDSTQQADARGAALSAGRRAPGAAAGCRQPAGRARDLSRHPRSRRPRGDRIAARLRPEDARALLGELVYHDPAASGWFPRPSTSPATSAQARPARHAAQRDPDLEVNVAALERVLPPDLGRGHRAAAGGRVDRRRHPPAVPRGDPRRPHRPGRASRRRDLGCARQQPIRAGDLGVGHRPLPARRSPRPRSSSDRSRSPTRSTTANASAAS